MVVTQSNNAANVIALRLTTTNRNIEESMIRLVSNNTIDRNQVPHGLHSFSASIVVNVDPDEFDSEFASKSPIKRNRNLEYLKNFRIFVSTCVGIGLAQGKDISDGFFTHVIVDEAGQCNGMFLSHLIGKYVFYS